MQTPNYADITSTLLEMLKEDVVTSILNSPYKNDQFELIKLIAPNMGTNGYWVQTFSPEGLQRSLSLFQRLKSACKATGETAEINTLIADFQKFKQYTTPLYSMEQAQIDVKIHFDYLSKNESQIEQWESALHDAIEKKHSAQQRSYLSYSHIGELSFVPSRARSQHLQSLTDEYCKYFTKLDKKNKNSDAREEALKCLEQEYLMHLPEQIIEQNILTTLPNCKAFSVRFYHTEKTFDFLTSKYSIYDEGQILGQSFSIKFQANI